MTIWDTPAEQAVADLVGSMRILLCPRAITQIKIPDLMVHEPQTVATLAIQTELHAGLPNPTNGSMNSNARNIMQYFGSDTSSVITTHDSHVR